MTTEYLAPSILSSRRLFGPNLFSSAAGAVLEVVCDGADAQRATDAWPAHARRLASALGWSGVECHVQIARASAMLFMTAPLDGLLTASDLTEHAWVAAERDVSGGAAIDASGILRDAYARERRALPQVVAIAQRAREQQLSFSLDDLSCSVGSGTGVLVVPHSDTPLDDASEFDDAWDSLHDVPTVLVTGSNGKTTTTRLIAAMCRAHGWRTGWSCSDGVWVDDEQLESGDFTGPGGARRVLCDQRVQAAVLETARGGMLRRGLATTRASAAIITNISADHFGEYGVETLSDLARVKSTVARVLPSGAPLVLNADDETLVALAPSLTVPICWFSVTDSAAARDAQSGAIIVRDGNMLLRVNGGAADVWIDLGDVQKMPLTLDGRATHNIANIAGAALTASLIGVPADVLRVVLSQFGASHTDNPGRLMVTNVGGVDVLMDYAHNPDGMVSLCRTAAAMPAERRLLMLGQAGNRDDEQLRALGASAWQTQSFDRVIIKEMTAMQRGRALGEIPAQLRAGLAGAGAPDSIVTTSASEIEGVRDALGWARAGDLLVLGIHVERARVLALMTQLREGQWKAGEPLPVE